MDNAIFLKNLVCADSSYTDSNRPGPVWRCTSIANPITRSVSGSASSIMFHP